MVSRHCLRIFGRRAQRRQHVSLELTSATCSSISPRACTKLLCHALTSCCPLMTCLVLSVQVQLAHGHGIGSRHLGVTDPAAQPVASSTGQCAERQSLLCPWLLSVLWPTQHCQAGIVRFEKCCCVCQHDALHARQPLVWVPWACLAACCRHKLQSYATSLGLWPTQGSCYNKSCAIGLQAKMHELQLGLLKLMGCQLPIQPFEPSNADKKAQAS